MGELASPDFNLIVSTIESLFLVLVLFYANVLGFSILYSQRDVYVQLQYEIRYTNIGS